MLAKAFAVRDAVLEETDIAPGSALASATDLLMAGKKFCGILTEMHAEPDRVHFLVIGIGVDVNHSSMPQELAGVATSLRMVTGAPLRLAGCTLLVRLLRNLETYYNRFLTDRTGTDHSSLRRRLQFCERQTCVRITTAAETLYWRD